MGEPGGEDKADMQLVGLTVKLATCAFIARQVVARYLRELRALEPFGARRLSWK